MFQFLKDKLKSTIKKISDSISKEGEESVVEEFRKPTEDEVKKAKIDSLKEAIGEKQKPETAVKQKPQQKTEQRPGLKHEPKSEHKPALEPKSEHKLTPKPEPKEEKKEDKKELLPKADNKKEIPAAKKEHILEKIPEKDKHESEGSAAGQKEEKAQKEKTEEKEDRKHKEETENKEQKQQTEEKPEEQPGDKTKEKKGFFAKLKDKFVKKEEKVEKEIADIEKQLPPSEAQVKHKVEVSETVSEQDIKEAEPEEIIEKAEEKLEKIKTELKEKPASSIREELEEVKEEVKEAVEEEIVKEAIEEEAEGFLAKLKQKIITKKINESQFDELFWELEVTLLENNVAVEVIEKIKLDLKSALVDKPIKRSQITDAIIASLKDSISGLFDIRSLSLLEESKKKKPYIICFVGVNGSGKTTTIAKVAHLFKKNGLKPVMAAADTFRAAAIQQLEEHANNLNVKMIKHDYGSDSAAVAFDAIKYAEAKGMDIVLIDTAGRLHSNTNLMDELKKLVRVAKPDATIFIGEAITGNDCVEQAMKFNEAVGIDAIILAKADVDEKGGAAISVSYVTKKPILYLGTGQSYDDFEEFDPQKLMESLGL